MDRIDYEARFHAALKEIAHYMRPEQHRRRAELEYGLSPYESMEMAIDNMIDTAKQALRGYHPKKRKGSAISVTRRSRPGDEIMSNDCYAYVRNYYKVPAYVGVRVRVNGRDGVLTRRRCGDQYVYIRFDGETRPTGPFHPTDGIDYRPAGADQETQ